MIKLVRAPKPSYLTEAKEQELVARFIADTKKRVWGHKSIGTALASSSFSKCAYCECKLGADGTDLTVDHFKYKDLYRDLVAAWENLLPACGHCNSIKNNLDVEEFAIINPYDIDPRAHMNMRNYRLVGLTDLGRNTIKVLRLNDIEKIFVPRSKVGAKLDEKLEEVVTMIERDQDFLDIRNKVIDILQLCQETSSYSAVMSTFLHNNENYHNLKLKLEERGRFDAVLTDLHEKSSHLVLGI